MAKLFDNDSDCDLDLKTDTEYAKDYNKWRKKEELHKLEARYGDISSNTDSSSDDDDDEELDQNFDKDFFKTLSCLKTKDSRIYDKTFDFFGTEEGEPSKSNKKKKKDQPMYIKDYERNIMLEKGGQLSDEENEDQHTSSKPFTYNDEQNELKENLKYALDNVDEDGEEGEKWGGLFKTREKTNQEIQKEDDDYVQWLAGQSQNLNDKNAESDLKPLKQFWTDPKLEEGEKFLRDYILKKRFLEAEDADYVPTYDEVVHDSDENFSEEEKALDKQDEFEHKYNFRFEEPDQEFIKRYPRTMEQSLRQKDDKRKVKRLERKERKAEEKKQKMEEINKLKELKKLEIEEKISKLKEITGNTEIGFDVKDFEDDFDPDEHDKRMQSLFNEEFYDGPEGEQKPEFPDLDEELELENWDRWHGNEGEEDETKVQDDKRGQPHCEDENFNMDCDYDPATLQQELINNSKRKKKRKRKSKFAKVLSEPKPVFDPNDRTYEEYLDEYYKLDCEDIIGDIPCRFKYRKVIPNDFGLTVEEILGAKDKELNRWCSLKKALQYRPDHVEKYDVIAFSKKAKNVELKKKYLPSLFEQENNDSNAATTNNTTETEIQKKHKTTKSTTNNTIDKTDSSSEQPVTVNIPEQTIKKRKRKHTTEQLINDNEDLNTKEQVNNTTNAIKHEMKRKEERCDVISPTKTQNSKNKKRKHKLVNLDDHQLTEGVSKPKKIKREKFDNKKSKPKVSKPLDGISDARLAAYGFKPKKIKNKLKYGGSF